MNKRQEANKIIQSNVTWSMGAGAVPIPIVDLAAVTAVQVGMLNQIAKVYEVDFSESAGKHLISALTGSTLARLGASFVKGIPFLGQIIGGVSMSLLSGASTYALGQVFINHFENGGNFFDFNINFAQTEYENEFKKGKEYAKDVQKKDDKPKNKADIFERLEKLVELKKQGIITEEEFNSKKQELLGML